MTPKNPKEKKRKEAFVVRCEIGCKTRKMRRGGVVVDVKPGRKYKVLSPTYCTRTTTYEGNRRNQKRRRRRPRSTESRIMDGKI